MKPIIETQNLIHEYKGGVVALKGINLNIFENEVISVIGQNGSGKTTLVRHFNGLLKPTRGKVLIEGEEAINKSVGYLSKKVGYVFQNPNHQIFCKTVFEELTVGPTNFKFTKEKTKEKVDYVVDLFNLQDILTKHPMTLDYTKKKLVSIASVMTFEPKVLILDEPTGGLDVDGRELLKNTMKLLHEQGNTIIMISHDMDFVAENTNRIIVMSEGQILLDSNANHVFQQQEILDKAWIEPPQIAMLSSAIDPDRITHLSVNEFVSAYKNKLNKII
ncbi:energy-coupling factor ABC transporter ATP-binding protein [Neobacillus sp. FSL H8-0543]|uniref:energy-coupling factor ABC transporter ATP-binding protein n=1 Tax=Neobacillus sp. FSL H8-0543 TaxID=2954672 RepID=UPI003158F09D